MSRARRRLLLIALVVAALFWVSAFFAAGQRPAPAQDGMAGRPAWAGAVGVNLEASELTGDGLAATLDRLSIAGIRWLRFTLPWDQIEPARDQYAWAPFDHVFEALAAYPDLQPVVVLDGAPPWARVAIDVDNPAAPPHERADFGAFAAAVAARYGAQVRYYQIWHEPNIAPHWGARPADPTAYAGLLREAAVQLRATDPDAQIVLAALAPTIEAGGANLSDIVYLDALYRQGARAWFDVVAAEPYGFFEPALAAPDVMALNFARVTLLHDVMARHADRTTPLWATAFGWNALPDDWAGRPSSWGQVSETAQAENAQDALAIARTRWPWLGPLFWAADCPARPADDPWRGFALCVADAAPRPIWETLAAAAQAPATLPPGNHAVDHPALHYSAGWRVTPSAADPGADGDSLAFAFYGTGLALRVQGGPYWAFYRVAVDGRPANALPRDESGAAYLVLHDPLAEVRVAPVASDLPVGVHQVRLEVVGGWGQWALQGVLVTDASRVFPGQVFPAWLAAAGLMSLLAAALAWLPLRRFLAWLDKLLERIAAWPSDGALWAEALSWLLAIGLAATLALSRWLIVDLAALAGLGLLFLARPDLALPLIAASIPFWPTPKELAGREFSFYEILTWLAVAVAVARWAVGRLGGVMRRTSRGAGMSDVRSVASCVARLKQTVGGLDWPVLALVGVGLAATLAAERFGVALREFRTVFLGGAAFYWLITRGPGPAGRRFSPWPVLNGFLAGMVVVGGLALWQLATGQGRVDVEGVWRVRALYGSPNNLALVLDRATPLALAIAAFGAGRSRAQRLGYGLVAAIMGIACLATFSKGALLLGLPVGVGLVLLGGAWRGGRRWPAWAAAAGVIAGAVGLVWLFRTPRFADLFNFETGTSFFRLRLWQGAWRMALDHPWLGVGPDNFLYAYRTRYVLPSAWQELNLSHPHNIVLDLGTRLGLPGLLIGGWALLAGARRGWRWFRTAGAPTWPLALGLLAGLAATVAHGLIDNSLFLVDLMAIFMLTLGLFQRLGAEDVAR
ncbi:MAG: hypothetical protein CVU38_08845 [Chloroflexi bacterium HGW-Chloroflexi-1]|nr:MAG: hypothetical protein CVU38_08845 [Chloroflexi bacterium HGW-Chloroflexi-1]